MALLPSNTSPSFPAGAAPAPKAEDFAPAINAKADAIDEGVARLIPPASRYSGANLRAFANAALAACSLLDGKTYKAEPVKGSEETKTPVAIPLDLAKHYFAVWQALQAFAKAHPDDAADLRPLPPLEALVGDGDLALASVALAALNKNKAFKSFLKEEAPESPAEQATDTGPEMAYESDESPHKGELDVLFGE